MRVLAGRVRAVHHDEGVAIGQALGCELAHAVVGQMHCAREVAVAVVLLGQRLNQRHGRAHCEVALDLVAGDGPNHGEFLRAVSCTCN